jgi:hypothetical protein
MPLKWQSQRQRFLMCCTLLLAVSLLIQPTQVVQTQEIEQKSTILLTLHLSIVPSPLEVPLLSTSKLRQMPAHAPQQARLHP